MTKIPTPPDPIDIEVPDVPMPVIRDPISVPELPEGFEPPKPNPLLYQRDPQRAAARAIQQRTRYRRFHMLRALRPLILALLTVLSALGFINDDLAAVIRDNADAIVTGLLAVWAVISHGRNMEDAGKTILGSPKP